MVLVGEGEEREGSSGGECKREGDEEVRRGRKDRQPCRLKEGRKEEVNKRKDVEKEENGGISGEECNDEMI